LLYISVSKPPSSSSLCIPGSMPVLNDTSGELIPGCSTCSTPTTHCSTNTHLIPAFLFCPDPPYRRPLSSFLFYLFISHSFDYPCTEMAEMICIHSDMSSCSHALRRLAKKAGEVLDLCNTSQWLLPSSLICHINNPIGSHVSHCCFNTAAVRAQLTKIPAMDIFQSWCPAKASHRLLPSGFSAALTWTDKTNALRHFYNTIYVT